jgi:hypothetical protein
MKPRIDRKLNLVVPIYGDEIAKLDGAGQPVLDENKQPVMEAPIVAWVHSTPLSAEIIDRYFMVITQTFSAIFSQGLGVVGGPAAAMRLLRSGAQNSGIWADNEKTGVGVENGLVAEIRRLTMVSINEGSGWASVPLQVAQAKGFLTTEDVSEVENAIVFFIVVSATLPRTERKAMVQGAAALWGALVTSLNSTEWTASLTTSTATGSSGGTSPAPASDVHGPASATVDGKPASVPH